MATIIDALVVTLGLDSSGFKKGQKEVGDGLNKTKKEAESTAKDMEAAGKRASSFFGSIRTELLALVGVTLSAQGIKTFITSMTSDLMRLGIESRALDISAKSLDGWERAASAAGSSAEKMSGTLAGFQKVLTSIRTGGGQDDPLFGALAAFGGATGANFDYQNDNSEAIMRKIAANWGKLSKDAQRRFGGMFGFDNATQQGLSNGTLVRDADRFAQISKATDEATKKALEFNRRLEEMKQNFSAAAQVLYEALIPYVEKLIPLIEKFGIWIATHGPEIEKTFSNISETIGGIVDAVGGWENVLTALLVFVGGKWLLGITSALGGVRTSLLALSRISLIAGLVELQKYAEKLENKYAWLKDNPVTNFLNEGTGTEKTTEWGKGFHDWVYGKTGIQLPRGDGYVSPPQPTKEGKGLLDSLKEKFSSLEKRFGLPEGLLRSVATTESAGNSNAVSSAGAKGLFQFMDPTAKDLGLSGSDVYNPEKSSEAAARYLSQLMGMTGGNLVETLAAYNWGIGNVQNKGLGAAPEETRNYIPKVLSGIQVGASSSAMRSSGAGGSGGNKTDIHISEANFQTSASNANALGEDIQKNLQRNRLVTPMMSGQG